MSDLVRDLRFAVRTLARTPAWTLVTVLVLALGIGSTTTMFGVADVLLLRQPPFRDPDRVVLLQQMQPQSPWPERLSKGDFHAYHDRATSFEALAAFTGGRFTLTEGGEPEGVDYAVVSSAYFRIFDGRPLLGRVFAEGDREADALVVLSFGLWQRRFGADSGVVGRTIRLSGKPYRVIGVMPPRYVDGSWADLWTLSDFAFVESERGMRSNGSAGRLKPGVSVAQANAELQGISRQLAAEYPATNTHVTALVTGWRAWSAELHRPQVTMLLGAVALVLLVACANVAGLMLARGSTRRGELAVRAALGATRGRIVRQLLTESALLSVAGGALGLVFAEWGIALVIGGLAPAYPWADDAGVDARAAAFALGCSFVAAIGAGLWPAAEASRWDIQAALQEGGARATASRAAELGRSVIVAAQIALAFALLAGAGVLAKSFAGLLGGPRGFDPRHVYMLETQLPEARYPDAARRGAFADAALARLHAWPGVEAAAVTSAPPIVGTWNGFCEVEGRPPWPRGGEPAVSIQVASPSYARVLGVAVREGRFLVDGDRAGAPPVAVVNETFAKRFFPGERAIGKRIRTDWGEEGHYDDVYREIVGIYADTKNRGLTREAIPEALFPFAQHVDQPTFMVRAGSEALATAAMRGAVHEIDPALALAGKPWARGRRHASFEEYVALTIGAPRFHATLLAIFAALGLALAAIGVFGVVAYSVEQRTREIAVRITFGARPLDIVRLVLARTARLVAAGLGAGLAVSFYATRLLAALVYGVSPLDPAVLAGAAVVLAAVALGAGLYPAWRASRTSPMVALRAA